MTDLTETAGAPDSTQGVAPPEAPLLSVKGLSVWANTAEGQRVITTGTDLAVRRGETIGIVGESGSGKSLSAKAIARLLPSNVGAEGEILFDDRNLMELPETEMRRLRGGQISMLLQDPFTMLNPLLKCGKHIEEMLAERKEFSSRAARRAEVQRRLQEVGITDENVADRMPFQLSGGMSQRVALAAALARDPSLLIADEPSTALDVTTQAEIMKLLQRVQRQRGMSLVLITHDLRLAFSICDRIYIMYAGSVMEAGPARDVETAPLHPYSLGLLLSEPPADRRVHKLVAIRGSVPRADEVTGQCSFADRCDWATDICRSGKPPLAETGPGRFTACVRQAEIRDEMDGLRQQTMTAEVRPPEPVATDAIARAEVIVKTFENSQGKPVNALKGVSLSIGPGQSVGLVGESGSGKTTLGRCLVGLETPTSGTIEIDGIDVSDFSALSTADRKRARQTVQMVFQDPYSTLNPKHTIGRSLIEAVRMAGGDRDHKGRVAELLREVGLPEAYAERRPASLSGGERQRVAIARALAVNPKMLVCDEPVSALDVSVQAQVLNLFKRLQEERGISYLFITHDLAVVRQVVDKIYVLYLGEIVEWGDTEKVMAAPEHAYTRKLIDSIP